MRAKMRSTATLLVVGALALTACSAGTPEKAEGAAELESLSIMVPYFTATPPAEDDPIGEKLEELAGVDLDIRWVPNADYQTQVNVTLASDDVPDAMVITSKDQGFVQTAEAGGFWDLTDYLDDEEQYPNLAAADPAITKAASINGKVYGIYRQRDLMRQSLVIRKDWLENLGLDLPETTDELADVARAFTEDDPDGNGVDDTYGIIWANWGGLGSGNSLDAVAAWFGAGNLWVEDKGELEPGWAQPEWKESLDYLRGLYEDGYLNADFATKNADTWNESFINGEGGIIVDQSSRATSIITLLRENDPENFDQYVELTGQPEGPNGAFALPTAGYGGLIAISKATIQTEEQLRAVLTVLDRLNSREAQVLMANGIEGVNFEVEDGYAAYDPAQQAITDNATQAWAQLGMNVARVDSYLPLPLTPYDEHIMQARLDLMAEDEENAVFNAAAGLTAPSYVTKQTTLDQIIADARVQYIAGEIDEDGLDAAVERWRSSGGDEVAAELNELHADIEK